MSASVAATRTCSVVSCSVMAGDVASIGPSVAGAPNACAAKTNEAVDSPIGASFTFDGSKKLGLHLMNCNILRYPLRDSNRACSTENGACKGALSSGAEETIHWLVREEKRRDFSS